MAGCLEESWYCVLFQFLSEGGPLEKEKSRLQRLRIFPLLGQAGHSSLAELGGRMILQDMRRNQTQHHRRESERHGVSRQRSPRRVQNHA
eukprot:6061766-Amphidinium_carterae.1